MKKVQQRVFAYSLSLLLGIQPLLLTAEVIVDNTSTENEETQVDTAANGIEVVNISRASAGGVSHNQYLQFDVDSQGLILNNAQSNVQTELGGFIEGNANLSSGSANIILNEVTSARRTQLNGYTEIAGQAAELVIANPNGISCQGCGFINTPRASLTTGTPDMQDGRLRGFSVSGGEIAISGLNASNIERLDLLTRAITLNGAMYAQQLNIITGRNDIDYATLAASALADNGSEKPSFALDAAAIGGMYANSIRLIGTESGVGVRIPSDMAASLEDLFLDVNGNLSLSNTQSVGNATLLAHNIDLNGTVLTGGDLALNGDVLKVNSNVAAQGDITIKADHLTNSGSLAAGSDGRRLIGNQQLNLNLSETLNNSGNLLASGDLSLRVENINNAQGQIASIGKLNASAETLNNRQGTLVADSQIQLSIGAIENDEGLLYSASSLSVSAGTISNVYGEVFATELMITATEELNNDDGQLFSENSLQLNSDSLSNGGGAITTVNGGINLDVHGNLSNSQGLIESGAALTLSAGSLTNIAGTVSSIGSDDSSITTSGFIDNSKGAFQSNGKNFTLTGTGISNIEGKVIHGGNGFLNLTTTGELDNSNGDVFSNSSVMVDAKSLNNSNGSLTTLNGDIAIDIVQTASNAGGLIEAGNTLKLNTGRFNNSNGTVTSIGSDASYITSTSGILNNDDGIIQSNANTLTLSGIGINNSGTVIHAGDESLTLSTETELDNSEGDIYSNSTLIVDAENLKNAHGSLSTLDGDIVIEIAQVASNANGLIEAGNILNLKVNSFSNENGTVTSIGTGESSITASALLDNTRGIIQSNANNLKLNGEGINNTKGEVIHAGSGTVDIDGGSGALNNQQGNISSLANLSIHTNNFNNTSGGVAAPNITFTATNLTNDGGFIEGEYVDLTVDGDLNNGLADEGEVGLISAFGNAVDALKISIAGWFNNDGGMVQTNAETLAVSAETIINSGSLIHAGNGKLSLNSNGQLNNSSGLIHTSGADALLSAAAIDNTSGSIIHAGNGRLDLSVAAGNMVTNRGGVIGSNGTLAAIDFSLLDNRALNGNSAEIQASHLELRGESLLNNGGLLQASGENSLVLSFIDFDNTDGVVNSIGNVTAGFTNLNNSGGLFQSAKTLTLNLPDFNFSNGVFNGGENLVINTTGDLLNGFGNSLLSNGNISFYTDGSISNAGEISSLQNLLLSGTNLINSNTGVISGGGNLTLGFSGELKNSGRLSAGDNLMLSGTDLNNSGLLAAGSLLEASLNNTLENSNTLFSGGDMILYAGKQLSNVRGANIFAIDNIIVAANDMLDKSTQVLNESATIEAYSGSFSLYTESLINRKAVFSLTSSNEISEDSPAAMLLAGGDMRLDASTITNYLSLIGSDGNMVLNGNTLNNTGAGNGESELTIPDKFTDAELVGKDYSYSNNRLAGNIESYLRDLITRDDTSEVFFIQTHYGLHPACAIEPEACAGGAGLVPKSQTMFRLRANNDLQKSDRSILHLHLWSPERSTFEEHITASDNDGLITKEGGDTIYSVYSYTAEGNFSPYDLLDTTNAINITPYYINLAAHYPSTIQAGGTLSGTFTDQIDNTNISYNGGDVVTNNFQSENTQASGRSLHTIEHSSVSSVESVSASDTTINNLDIIQNSNSLNGIANINDLATLILASNETVSETDYITALSNNSQQLKFSTYNPVNNLTLPANGGLFIVNSAPDADYLVETNPELTDYARFISSDYLLGRLQVDADVTSKRLGDGFYESRLIRESIFTARGERYLAGYSSDYEQYLGLMNNALASQETMGLNLGIALSETQVQELSNDIIWLVEQEVAGEQVLVPVYYAATLGSDALLNNGALLSGLDIDLESAMVNNSAAVNAERNLRLSSASDLLNKGVIQSGQMTTLNAGNNLRNTGLVDGDSVDIEVQRNVINNGLLNGGSRLSVVAQNDIRNESTAQITSTGDLSLIAREGSIVQARDLKVTTTESGQGRLTRSRVGAAPSIRAEGNLSAEAGTDIIVGGTSISAGGDLVVSAGRDIEIAAIETRRGSNNGIYSNIESTKQLNASVDAGGSIVLQAGRDTTISASDINANNNIGISSGENTSITSAVESTYFSGYKERSVQSSSINQASTLNASDGDVSITSGNDLDIVGSSISAGEDITLNTSGNTTIAAVNDEEYRFSEVTQRRSFGRKTTTTEEEHIVSNVGSSINAGGDLFINAITDEEGSTSLIDSGRVDVTGSDVSAIEGDLIIYGGEDITLDAGNEEYDYFYQRKKRGALGLSGSSRTVQSERELTIGTSLTAGTDAMLISGNDTNVLASSIAADENIDVEAKNNINILSSSELQRNLSVNSSYSFGGLNSEAEGASNTSLTQVASNLSTQTGNISLSAGNNLSIAGSDLDSGQNIHLIAFDQIEITTSDEQHKDASFSEEAGIFSGGNFYESEIEKDSVVTSTTRGSNLSAANDVGIDAGTARIIGSEITANNDIVVLTDVGDIEILSANQSSDADHYEETIEVGLPFDGFSNPIKIEAGQLKVTLGKASYDSLESSEQTSTNNNSTISAGYHVTLDAAGDIAIRGSSVIADNDTSAEGNATLITDGNIEITSVTDTYASESKTIHGEAEASFVVQHQAVEIAKATKALDAAKEQLKTANEDKRAYEKSLIRLKSQLSDLERSYQNNEPGARYGDVLELRELVKDVEDDKAWYDAGIALAALNVTSSTTLLAQQISSAANSAGSYAFGLNVGLQLDIEASQSENSVFETNSVTSSVEGNNVLLKSDAEDIVGDTQILIQGSQLNAADTLIIETGELVVEASRDTSTAQNDNQSLSASVGITVFGANSGATVSGSISHDRSKDRSSTYTNSSLTGDTVLINTEGNASIGGGNIHADNTLIANIGGDLVLESQQNRASGSNNSIGVSAGFNLGEAEGGQADQRDASGATLDSAVHNTANLDTVTSASGGINGANGSYQEKETVLSSITSGGTANISVEGDTQIVGALIATVDENGNDLGNLTFSSNTLSYTDLNNSSFSENQSAGINANIGIAGNEESSIINSNQTVANTNPNAQDVDGVSVNSSQFQYENESGYTKGQTLATIGEGSIIINDEENSDDLAQLNRELVNLEEELFSIDRQQGNVNLTLDQRLLSEGGRETIKSDFFDLGENFQIISQGVPSASDDNDFLASIGEFFDKAGDLTWGLSPSDKNSGGVLGQIPILVGIDDNQAGAFLVMPEESDYVSAHPDEFVPASDLPFYDDPDFPQQSKDLLVGQVISIAPIDITPENATWQNPINGMNNTLVDAVVNGMQQTDATKLTQHYNPSHGVIPDLLESGVDKIFGKVFSTGIAKQTVGSVSEVVSSRGNRGANIVTHSQATSILESGFNHVGTEGFEGIVKLKEDTDGRITVFSNGGAASNISLQEATKGVGLTFSGSNVHKGDAVGEVIGGNQGLYLPGRGDKNIPLNFIERIKKVNEFDSVFLGDKYPEYDKNGKQTNTVSEHSAYPCVTNCGNDSPWENDDEE